MGKTLVVVESPAKAKTIKKYLGNGYEVLASKGHVKDLPKKLGIDVEKGFKETYEVIESKADVLKELRSHVKTADRLLLATDPDREGEAIAWHLAEELKRPELDVARVEFHEITKKGVQAGLDKPRALDAHLYDAQRSRRVLDRIVGYDVSALVWSKLAFGLSAGRVQSVALRLIVEREREIERFVPEEYWNIGAALRSKGGTFAARLTKADGEKIEVTRGDLAAAVRADLESSRFVATEITKKEQRRHAPAPYTTSKLQQDAASYLRFATKRTMSIAQKLYEGVDLKKDGGPVGLITYMRTDSVRVSPDAVEAVRTHIGEVFGAQHLPAKPNQFRSRKNAQEAHEAIRPTSLDLPPELVHKHLSDEQFKLYKLIWDRFVASQMADALYDQTAVDVTATPARGDRKFGTLTLRASGKVLKFAGWLAQYQGRGSKSSGDEGGARSFAGEDETEDAPPDSGTQAAGSYARFDATLDDEDGSLPPILEREALMLVSPPGVNTDQKFTQPPARFNEGSLVRELEKRGIGRPSTYSEIISKVQAREYVEKTPGGQLRPTDLGKMVVDGLVSTELEFMDPSFTAKMEEDLDLVGAGRMKRVDLLGKFYVQFRSVLDKAKKQQRWAPPPEPTEHQCPECGANVLKRWSRNGFFLGCARYPECKYTRNLGADGRAEEPVLTDYVCDKCSRKMIRKNGRYGEFLSCSGYPECKATRPIPLGVPCPKCGGDIVEIKSKKRGGRAFYGCATYPKCDFKLWQKPVLEACPNCANPYLVVGGGKKSPKIVCPNTDCGYSRPLEEGIDPVPESETRPGAGSKRASSAATP